MAQIMRDIPAIRKKPVAIRVLSAFVSGIRIKWGIHRIMAKQTFGIMRQTVATET